MQLVTTNIGMYIDNVPLDQYGDYQRGSKGYDWKTLIDKGEVEVNLILCPTCVRVNVRSHIWINTLEQGY